MKSVTHSIFKTFLLSLLMVAQMHFAYAQTASILPPAKTTFFDANGNPLTAGTVESFIPATTTHKTTWQDAAETIPNANPLTLDAAGRALLLGSGSYRQVVKDRFNNVIWDQVTSSTGSGAGGPTATGDGDLVGTIKPWAGMTAPNQYVFTYGQELSRATYSALFTAITSTQSVFCNSGSAILSGLGDTTNFWVGMTIEISCVAAGNTTLISKTATTVTMAVNANVTTNVNAIFFPWGRGNGSTTFNMPDFRGFAIAGNDIMGGVAANRLTTTYFGATDPNSSGAAGGAENTSITLTNSNLPSGYTPAGTMTSTTTDNVIHGGTLQSAVGGGAQTTVTGGTFGLLTSTGTLAGNLAAFGGTASAAQVGAVGSGYTNGAQTITISGGTCTTQPQFTVTVVGNAFTNPPVLLTAGSCTSPPNNPSATTGGGGTGGTLVVTYTTTPILKSIVPPTKTSNYIIKVIPDDNSATASGVTALGGMTGSIACGAGLLCTGNNISVTASLLSVGSSIINGGTNTRVLFDNVGILGEYTAVPVSVGGTGQSAINPNQIITGGVTNQAPFQNFGLGTTTTVLHGNAAGLPSWGSIVAADVTTNTLTNATLAQAAAATLKGNPTTGVANETDFTITGLTLKASPVAGDEILLSDSAASNGFKKATVSSIASAGSVASINGQTGAIVSYFQPQGRLTLTSVTPVMTTSVAGATTVFYTPYAGDMIPIYNGTNMIPTAFAEVSQATTDTTKSPAAATTNSIYDVFCWIDTGPTNRCTRGPPWTSDTARSAGTALVLQNGIFLNNASITNGPAASRGTYVGSIRTNGTSTVDYIFGAVGAGWTAANFSLWNAYNRVPVYTFTGDSTDTWTYAVANTWRAPNGNTTTARISSLRGLNIDGINCTYHSIGIPGAATNIAAGIGLDSTTAFTGITGFGNLSTANFPITGILSGVMGLGYHFCSAIELNTTTTASTWYGDAGVAYLQTGLSGIHYQ